MMSLEVPNVNVQVQGKVQVQVQVYQVWSFVPSQMEPLHYGFDETIMIMIMITRGVNM